jgi:5-methylcytosine-specific restriction endonuclease McrA
VADVKPAEIYDRDGWVCQLCGEKVDKRATWPSLMSASLDHVIPLSKGGTHEPSNCQLAHFICNSRKGDGASGEQLRLAV